MNGEYLPWTKAPPPSSNAARFFTSTGLSFDYLPAFHQPQHDFHTHPAVEMLYVLSGRFRHVTAAHTYDEAPGGLTLLQQGQFHALKTPHGPVELINIYWDPVRYPVHDLPDPIAGRLADLIPPHPALSLRLNRVLHLRPEGQEEIAALLRMACAEQKKREPGTEAVLDAIFHLLLIRIARAAPAPGAPPVTDPAMEKLRRFLDRHADEPVRLEQLCALSGLNKANLCRRFKAYTGLTTGDYLTRCRLNMALRLLRTGNEKISTIVYESGFPDISRFNRIFRTAFGITPRQYRSGADPVHTVSENQAPPHRDPKSKFS